MIWAERKRDQERQINNEVEGVSSGRASARARAERPVRPGRPATQRSKRSILMKHIKSNRQTRKTRVTIEIKPN